MEDYQRDIHFEGVFNFRDIGGYQTKDGNRVKWRILFRSSELHHMTDSDIETARDDLGITTIIDLREPKVAIKSNHPHFSEPPFQYKNIWLVEDFDNLMKRKPMAASLAEDYLERFSEHEFGDRMVMALRAIVEPDACPAIFHCSAGKDRTGMLSMVILSLLGVPDEVIVQDYANTAKFMPHLIDRWWHRFPGTSMEIFARLPNNMYDARPETMEDVLRTLHQRHGTIRNYLQEHGADEGLFNVLENLLLE